MQQVNREMETKEVQQKAAAMRQARKSKLSLCRQQLVESRKLVVRWVLVAASR